MDVIKNAIRVLKRHYDYLKQTWKPYPDQNVLDAIGIAVNKYCPECGQAIDWSSDVAEEAKEE